MPDVFRQTYIHLIFAVKFREHLIRNSFSEALQKYITGIVQKRGNKMLAIKAMPDHVHIFIFYNPTCYIPDLVKEIKSYSTEYIKKMNWSNNFSWQSGYGVFSYSKSQISQVINYIQNQEKHHRHKSFKEEFLKILKDYKMEYNNDYLFNWICQEEKKTQ